MISTLISTKEKISFFHYKKLLIFYRGWGGELIAATLITGVFSFSSSELDSSLRALFTGTLGASFVRLDGLFLPLGGLGSSSLSDESTNSLDFGVVLPNL